MRRDCLKGDASWLEVVLYVIVLIILTSIPGFIFTIRHFFNTRRVSEQKGNSFFQCLLAGLAMTGYNVIMIPSVWIAYKRYLLGENSWLKTERETEN